MPRSFNREQRPRPFFVFSQETADRLNKEKEEIVMGKVEFIDVRNGLTGFHSMMAGFELQEFMRGSDFSEMNGPLDAPELIASGGCEGRENIAWQLMASR